MQLNEANEAKAGSEVTASIESKMYLFIKKGDV